jgi:hypothetical protein
MKKSTPLAEVTFTVRGNSITSVMKKISDPSKPALERAQKQLAAAGAQVAAIERELGAARMSEGEARAQALELQHIAESYGQRIEDALSIAMQLQMEPNAAETLKAYLTGTAKAPRWTHLCSKLNDAKTAVREGEKCPHCNIGKEPTL